MLCKATLIVGSRLEAADGAIGSVKDILFDDATWKVRYLVVDTGQWLAGRKVLLAPSSVENFSELGRILTTSLSRSQVESSPDVETHRTVTRQDEMSLHSHYGWTPYWSTGFVWPSAFAFPVSAVGTISYENVGTSPFSPGSAVAREISARLDPQDEDVHLGSFHEIRSYGLKATDGDLGRVEDLFVDPTSWQVTHVVADARTWWPGGEVVIDVSFVDDVLWGEDKIAVRLTKEQVKNSPPYDADSPFTDGYLLGLSGYYTALARTPENAGKPGDWSVPPSGE